MRLQYISMMRWEDRYHEEDDADQQHDRPTIADRQNIATRGRTQDKKTREGSELVYPPPVARRAPLRGARFEGGWSALAVDGPSDDGCFRFKFAFVSAGVPPDAATDTGVRAGAGTGVCVALPGAPGTGLFCLSGDARPSVAPATFGGAGGGGCVCGGMGGGFGAAGAGVLACREPERDVEGPVLMYGMMCPPGVEG